MKNHIENQETEALVSIKETEEQTVAAERRGLESSVGEVHAVAARYDEAAGELLLVLRGGLRLSVPVRLLQGVAGADPRLIAQVELFGAGSGLHWEELDADFSVQDIAAGSFGTRRWMGRLEEQGLLDQASIARRRQVDELHEQRAQDNRSKGAAAMGRRGGTARTASKVAASRANGAKGGRPRKQPVEA